MPTTGCCDVVELVLLCRVSKVQVEASPRRVAGRVSGSGAEITPSYGNRVTTKVKVKSVVARCSRQGRRFSQKN